jgi:hypothetical protein
MDRFHYLGILDSSSSIDRFHYLGILDSSSSIDRFHYLGILDSSSSKYTYICIHVYIVFGNTIVCIVTMQNSKQFSNGGLLSSHQFCF